MIWKKTYRAALEQLGFEAGRTSPCRFVHRDRSLHLVVHEDDLTALGPQADLDWHEKTPAKLFELKIRGRIGKNIKFKTMRILNRIVTLTPEGLIYESDTRHAEPRHAELMVRNLGLDGSKGVGTPGVKLPVISDEAPKDGGIDPWDDEPW